MIPERTQARVLGTRASGPLWLERAGRPRSQDEQCERKKRAPEALAYNALVQSWPEIVRLAHEGAAPAKPQQKQTKMFDEGEAE